MNCSPAFSSVIMRNVCVCASVSSVATDDTGSSQDKVIRRFNCKPFLDKYVLFRMDIELMSYSSRFLHFSLE